MKKHLLIIRFSALGDTAMLVPVVMNLLNQYPELNVTVLSNKNFSALFEDIERCNFFGADLKAEHNGIAGLNKLFKQISKQKFDTVADMHNVLRSKFLSFLFRLKMISVATIDKGRAEKKMLTQKENKQLHQLKSSHQRYADVLKKLDFPIELNPVFKNKFQINLPQINFTKQLIGIAPFAKHDTKMYPLERTKEVVLNLAKRENIQIVLFGGGKQEVEILENWSKENSNIFSAAGKFSFEDELKLISNLDLMLSMDSANMHLASIYGIKVVSIWGATHPFAGFMGWQQSQKDAVQIDLYCRPCSVFGNIPCYRGDLACLNSIKVEQVLSSMEQALIN